MGELQWALLIVCAVLVVLVYVFSRRARDEGPDDRELPKLAPKDTGGQTELFAARGDAEGNYDEFGVGKPRPRGTSLPSAPGTGGRTAPPLGPTPAVAPGAGASSGATAPTLGGLPPKVVALIVAPTEETDILGPSLHQALAAQGLQFGPGDIYHRMIGGRVVFSVAGLIKPGRLIPADAANFSTRGLTVALQLPGPVRPEVALEDMTATARALATALKADVYDMRRQPLTDDAEVALRAEVADWARANAAA